MHQFLLALVRHLHVLDELGKLPLAVLAGEQERLARLRQEVDELGVVPRRNAAQPRVRRRDERRDGRLEQLPQRRPLKGQRVRRRGGGGSGGDILPRLRLALVAAANTPGSGGRHGAPSKEVGQNGGALDVLDDHRHQSGELVLAERVAEGARPMDVVDGRMRILREQYFEYT